MNWRTGLRGAALEIAQTDLTPLRVMAGPGTGKTLAIMRRIARLLEEGQDPSRILAVTFTRNAAAALVDDIKSLEVECSDKIHAGTLHAYCFGLLKQADVFNLIGRVPRPLIAPEVKKVLKFEAEPLLFDIKSRGSFGGRRDCSKRIRAFEAAWARLQSEQPGWPTDDVDSQFHSELVQWLKFHEAMFIGELVPESLRFVRNNPAHPVLTAFDHVLVDEYQDLNRAEQELIDIISAAGSSAVIGDVDQSIYSFRFAHPEGIEQFNSTHPTTHDESLLECRRCPTRVVRIADNLIRHNYGLPSPVRLNPLSTNPSGDVKIVQWRSVDSEANGLANYVDWLINGGIYGAGDILILTPRRVLGIGIRDALKEKGIPAHSYFHRNVLYTTEAQRTFILLTLLVNNNDRVALRWWLGEGSSSTRTGEYARLRSYCEQSGDSPWYAMSKITSGAIVIKLTKGIQKKYTELRTELDSLESLDLSSLIERLFPDNNEACSILREIALLSLPVADTVQDLFNSIHGSITQPEMPKSGDFVRVMSIHKAKGLTSKVVLVADCIRGLIPFIDKNKSHDEQERDLKEQRRLFYVAITRCKEILVLSSVAMMERRMGHDISAMLARGIGLYGTALASPFLDELGPSAPTRISGESWQDNGWS